MKIMSQAADITAGTSSSTCSASFFNPFGFSFSNNDNVKDCPSSSTLATLSAFANSFLSYWSNSSSFSSSFSLKNTLFISASTMFNTLLFLAILYFWWANRQFHFQKRKKDGSRLSSIATNQDAKELQQLKKKQEQLRRHRRQQRRRRSKQRQRRTETNQEQEQEQEHDHKEDDDDKDDEDTISLSDISEQDSIDQQQLLVEEEEESEATWNLEDADLSDYDTDEDEQEASASTKGASDDDDFLAMLPPDKRRIAKDLTAVVANMEVFSYLSKDAFFQVMEHMEYIDLKQGQQLFSETTLDGSLYAVISGKVKCDFEFQPQTPPSPRAMKSPWNTTDSSDLDDDPSTAAAMMEPLISFTAGDGDIVTSLLTMLLGLVRQCQDRSTPPAAAPEQPQSLDNNNNNNNKLPIVPAGISVRAIGAAENTQIVRVPPQCFLACLDKYPEDVHRIAQTVVARMQRVTIQTVVRCLGLQKEIVRRDPNESTVLSLDQMALHPEAWGRLKAALPSYVPDAAPAKLQQQIMEDAACVATTNVMGRQHRQDATATDAEKDIRQKLLQVGSIVSLPPGATLIQTGSQTEAIYMILHGALDVGMNIAAGSASALNQSARRRASSTGYHPSGTTVRRSIFPPTKQIARTKLQASKQTTGTSSEQATGSKTAHNSSSKTVFSRIYKAVVGETVGRLSVFTGDASIVTIHNNSDWESAILFRIPKSDYEKIISEHPTALTQCLESILGRLMTPIVCLLDWNVEWLHVIAGEMVAQQGEPCKEMLAVLNGRLRSTPYENPQNQHQQTKPPPPNAMQRESSTGTTSFLHRRLLRRRRTRKNLPKVANAPPPLSRKMMTDRQNDDEGIEEYGRGAIIGELEILNNDNWQFDVIASRHSELARIPYSVINAIMMICPQAPLHLAKVVASQVRRKNNRKNKSRAGLPPSVPAPPTPAPHATDSPQKPLPSGKVTTQNILPSYDLSVATIAVVPLLEGDFDLAGFCNMLRTTLNDKIAPTKLMTKEIAKEKLGELWNNRNAMHALKMTRLLGDMEENYRLVVYQAERNYTWWTRLCIQQADCILVVVRGEQAPPQKKVEACLHWAFRSLNAKIQLVVLQSKPKAYNQDEDLDDAIMNEAMESSDQLNDWSENRFWIAGHHLIRSPFHKHDMDFTRLCRRVTGRSVGLVLGGGGARGLAHIGVIKALNEAGLTCDYCAGTSQGAYIGALYAMNPDSFTDLVKAARIMSASLSSAKEKLLDLTLPLVSFFSGYRFNRGIQKALGTRRIQDFVLNYCCVSCDIRNNRLCVHTKGVAWQYVRASMSLQSYLPPVSADGCLLVDGGYMNILPADIMKQQMGARTVIAVDVTQEVILDNYEYGTHLNGWWLLFNSWNPFVKTVKIPSMGDIAERLAWASAEGHRRKVKEHIDLFLQPPVGNYGVLEYDRFDEIVRIGYEYAKPRIDHFVKKNPHLVS